MTKYLVLVREVHVVHMEIEANSRNEALELVREGDGKEVFLEYSHTLEPDTWTVEEGRK